MDGEADDHGRQHAEDDVHQREGGVSLRRFLAEVDADQAKQAAPEHGDHR